MGVVSIYASRFGLWSALWSASRVRDQFFCDPPSTGRWLPGCLWAFTTDHYQDLIIFDYTEPESQHEKRLQLCESTAAYVYPVCFGFVYTTCKTMTYELVWLSLPNPPPPTVLVNISDSHQISCTLFGAGPEDPSLNEYLSNVMKWYDWHFLLNYNLLENDGIEPPFLLKMEVSFLKLSIGPCLFL